MNRWTRPLIFGLTLTLGACAAGPAKKSLSDEDAVSIRAQERADALVARDFEKAWLYLSRGYQSTLPPEEYVKRMLIRPVHWQSAKVKSATCEEGIRCTVVMDIAVSLKSGNPSVGMLKATTGLAHQWIKFEDEWYHVPKE